MGPHRPPPARAWRRPPPVRDGPSSRVARRAGEVDLPGPAAPLLAGNGSALPSGRPWRSAGGRAGRTVSRGTTSTSPARHRRGRRRARGRAGPSSPRSWSAASSGCTACGRTCPPLLRADTMIAGISPPPYVPPGQSALTRGSPFDDERGVAAALGVLPATGLLVARVVVLVGDDHDRRPLRPRPRAGDGVDGLLHEGVALLLEGGVVGVVLGAAVAARRLGVPGHGVVDAAVHVVALVRG